MEDFDKEHFEFLMSNGVDSHNQNQYEQALYYSSKAYDMAPDASNEKGRAARDSSARYDRLGNLEKAEHYADEAFEIHDTIVKDMGDEPSREALRERSVTAMYVGVSGLRKVIEARLNQETVNEQQQSLDMMRLTWSDLKIANKQASGVNRYVDQYQINASRRVSIAESIVGDKKQGLKIGLGAVALAFLSESPHIDTSNPNKKTLGRLKAKTKALGGALLALSISSLVYSKRSEVALKLANKAL
jgi:tetratricopeptide (TPR) repeat protein